MAARKGRFSPIAWSLSELDRESLLSQELDESLLTEVRDLLREHDLGGDEFESPLLLSEPVEVRETTGSESTELLHRIGAYRLVEQLGEGGFGVVYLAEQIEPVRRQVALKVLKAGFDSAAVIARFEAERQSLARMDHPNVAKVFDAGIFTRRSILLRHAACSRCTHHRVRTESTAFVIEASAPLSTSVRRHSARSSEGDRSSRHKAGERARHRDRWRTSSRGDRLRHC